MVFIKGQSGNPGGKVKGVSIVNILKEELRKIDPGTQKMVANGLVDVIIKKAVKNKDVTMIKDILNRVDGLPQAKVDVTTDGEKIEGIKYILPNEK